MYHYHEPDTKVTYYEANHNAAYKLVRSGKISEVVESRHGAAAKDVVMNLFQWGHTQVFELVAAYEKAQDKTINGKEDDAPSTNGINGDHGPERVRSTQQLHTILIQLLEAGIIEPVDPQMLRSPADTHNLFEKEIMREYRDGVKGAKGKEEVASKIRDRMRTLRAETSYWQPKTGGKRSLGGDGYTNGVSKKRKLLNGSVNGHSNGVEDGGAELDVGFPMLITLSRGMVANIHQVNANVASQLREVYSRVTESAISRISEAQTWGNTRACLRSTPPPYRKSYPEMSPRPVLR